MIVLRTPKGWTGPKEVDGKPTEGTWRSHQVPLAGMADHPEHVAALEAWMRSYRPEELFDDEGRPREELLAPAPAGARRMSASPHANGGGLLRPLHAARHARARGRGARAGRGDRVGHPVLGAFLRDVMRAERAAPQLPDHRARRDGVEPARAPCSSDRPRLGGRAVLPTDDHLASGGRVMEVLSEHLCQGWLEGYLLTGRHGLFNCYEAFIHIVDSMFNQHAKWLKTTREHPVAAADRVAQLPAHVATSGGRTTTGSRTRTPASSTTW